MNHEWRATRRLQPTIAALWRHDSCEYLWTCSRCGALVQAFEDPADMAKPLIRDHMSCDEVMVAQVQNS